MSNAFPFNDPDSGEDELAHRWAQACYDLVSRHSWVLRKTEHREYQGRRQWRRSVSLDISMEAIAGYLADHSLDSSGEVLIPIATFRKGTIVSEFDLEDSRGNARQLVPGLVSSTLGVMLICGGVERERRYNPILDNHERKHPIHENHLLQQLLLHTWINEQNLPVISRELPDDQFFEEARRLANERIELGFKRLKNTEPDSCPPKDEVDRLNELKKDLDTYFQKSVSFRFFMRFFYYARILWTSIELSDSSSTILKYRYVVGTDIFAQSEAETDGSVPFNVRFDGIPYAENYHFELKAPGGSIFIPYRLKVGDNNGEGSGGAEPVAANDAGITGKGQDAKPIIEPCALVVRAYECANPKSHLLPSSETKKTIPFEAYKKFSGRSLSLWTRPLRASIDSAHTYERLPMAEETSEKSFDLVVRLAAYAPKRATVYRLISGMLSAFWFFLWVYLIVATRVDTVNTDLLIRLVIVVMGFLTPLLTLTVTALDEVGHLPIAFFREPRKHCYHAIKTTFIGLLILVCLISYAEKAQGNDFIEPFADAVGSIASSFGWTLNPEIQYGIACLPIFALATVFLILTYRDYRALTRWRDSMDTAMDAVEDYSETGTVFYAFKRDRDSTDQEEI